MAVTRDKKTFRQANFAAKLRVPEGAEYVEASDYDEIKSALEEGLAVYVESCAGRAFLWREGEKIKADMFFHSPASAMEFDSIDAAADFASELCEGSAITD